MRGQLGAAPHLQTSEASRCPSRPRPRLGPRSARGRGARAPSARRLRFPLLGCTDRAPRQRPSG
eukprot:6476055-Alexandrium_andersonii.AAC.1